MALLILASSVLIQAVAANYHPYLLPRQTEAPVPGIGDDTSGDCLSSLLEVAGDAPYPPSEIVDVMTSFFMTATGTYDAVCGWQTNLPSSLADEWYSYQSEVMSWYSDNTGRISSALEKCPESYKSSAGPCTKTIAGLPPPANAQATGGSGGSSGDKPNGGESQRGYLIPGAAVGMAGVLGAAMLL